MTIRTIHRLDLLLLLVSLSHGHLLRAPSAEHATLLEKRAAGYDSKIVQIDVDAPDHRQEFQQFVTRPDIDAPRWNIHKYNESAIAPGYWFLAPYQEPEQKKRGGAWVGPHIYDQEGELIWSGVPLLKGFDAFDFRMSTVQGRDMLSMIYRHENGLLINSNYEVEQKFDIADDKGRLNMHDFHFAENGTTALMLKTKTSSASDEILEQAGKDYPCRVHFYGIEEVDVASGRPVFSWWAAGHVGLEETVVAHAPKEACRTEFGLDYLHANAVDKFPDGDYLFSGRHCNTIYKISAKDGSIVWRFGGKKSDFKWDGHFSGQHHTRVRGQNSTHTLISFLDNAYVPRATSRFSNDFSRGFLIALRTDLPEMTAETVAQYDHPHGDYALGRGSYQVLPNGNTYVGWTSYSLVTEYDVNGDLVLEASLKAELKTYRGYKFPWVGHPTERPAVHSTGVTMNDNRTVSTSVHVSWNGATEVKKWNLYRTKADGSSEEMIASLPRQGFETALTCPGFVAYVVLEAVDEHGKPLGRSDVTQSVPPKNIFHPSVLAEQQWQQQGTTSGSVWTMSIGSFGLAFALGVVCCALGSLVGCFLWQLRLDVKAASKWPWTPSAYKRVTCRDETDDTLVGEEDDEVFRKKGGDVLYDCSSGDGEV